jgi:urease accessory protein
MIVTIGKRCVSLPVEEWGHGHRHPVSFDPTATEPDPHWHASHHGRAFRIGIGGPVGSGKTALTAALCRALGDEVNLAVVTNDIYTTEDADFLRRAGVLAPDRIEAVQTGACPHTAIRDDITANLDAVERLEQRHPGLELVVVESGGDNLTAVFSRGLADRQMFVVDVAGGDKVPRKGGPGVTTADLLVINKVDLADQVGADMAVMVADAHRMRGELPVITQSLTRTPNAPDVTAWVRDQLAALAVAEGA